MAHYGVFTNLAPLNGFATPARERAAAVRDTRIGRRVTRTRPIPATYTRGARAWSPPWNIYPTQSNGVTVVGMEDYYWEGLNPAQQALFPLTSPPAGFDEGNVPVPTRGAGSGRLDP